MLFNDFLFILILLPAAALLFFLPPFRPYRVYTILLTSFVFYEFSGGVRQLGVMITSIVWVYFFSVIIKSEKKLPVLLASISFPALALIYFKYSNFLLYDFLFLEHRSGVASFSLFEQVVLPAGISFYTFQLISYAVDRYRGGKEKPRSLAHFGFYISFFPQLIAGPILRYDQISRFLNGIVQFRLSARDTGYAIIYFVFGLAFKVLIADVLDKMIAPMLGNTGTLDGLSRLFVILAYSNQIYFDFFGYSLMAMGIGRLFGFTFPLNFRMPYRALNPKAFWRRWHVTLSYWIRDYVYVSLGGNNNYVRNILIVFLLCGLWHGAGWNFIVWGGIHGMFVIFYAICEKYWNATPPLMQWLVTYSVVSTAWVLFLFDMRTALDFFAGFAEQPFSTDSSPGLWMWFALAAATTVSIKVDMETVCRIVMEEGRYGRAAAVLCGILFVLGLGFLDQSSNFIYFRF